MSSAKYCAGDRDLIAAVDHSASCFVHPARGFRRSGRVGLVIAAAVALVAIAGLVFWASRPQPRAGQVAPTNSEPVESGAAAKPQGSAVFQGRWYRPDGGYLLEVKSVAADGKAQAAYFNPRPINVAKAQVTSHGGQLKLFVELRDEGYPGSTYELSYRADRDELTGTYFQAASGESYNVYFSRMPAEGEPTAK